MSTDTDDDATAKRDDAIRAQGVDPATGFAITGDYPTNGRLRAEALARDGVTTDEGGIVSDDLIAATKDRLDRERAEEERAEAERQRTEAAETPTLRWDRDRLVAAAEKRGLVVETDANKPTILDAITAFDNAKEG